MSALRAGESKAVLALGSNLGDRAREIDTAVSELSGTDGIRLLAFSPIVETRAVKVHGVDEFAPRYLNAVAVVATTLAPEQLLHQVNRIEDAHGRVRDERWGDRTLDIDVVCHGDIVSDTPQLTLPHPRAAGRDFVLAPWLAADPDAELPGIGRVDELLAGIEDTTRPWTPGGAR